MYRVILNDCRSFNNLSYTMHLRQEYTYFFYLIEQHSQFLLHTLQVLYMCALCDSTSINTIIEFWNCLQLVSGDGFNGGCCLQNHKGCTYRAPATYVTKTWSVVLLNKKYIYYLKYIVYDKLLKPRQSFQITLYVLKGDN